MIKITLDENEVPKNFYNVLPDLPEPLAPPLNPKTREPVSPSDLEAIFPKELIRQEMSAERSIPIPNEVRDALIRFGRPTPLIRAERLEKALRTPAKIYFKHEGLNPCGSHKPNTAIAQAYYNAKEGIGHLATETGAGQWGTALAYASMLFGLKCTVFMVRNSFEQKPGRKTMIESYGATIHASPSPVTAFGRKVRAEMPDTPGSLGIAISEAIEVAASDAKTNYSLGSVLNHVLLHQTVIGQELRLQLAKAEIEPDFLIGCIGGGSNFGGMVFPFVRDKMAGRTKARLIGVEPESCPSVTKGEYRYDSGDTAGMTPLLKMHTLGSGHIPPAIHAGGLRYHGMAPTVSLLMDKGIAEAEACGQGDVLAAARLFASTEGIIAAPESSHAIASAMRHAMECRKSGEEKTIVFNLSGHGLLDLSFYEMAGGVGGVQ
ncbi:TrpB-like pyridoxal phosphate-dependent enzyme [Candidatus Micrarchaeota archaeon]|nr:TrpB-like pyridoxal phosphate-dependent enzyme [Candidatus Micrarchaeota archaeon]